MDRSRIIASILHTYPLYSGCGTLANHRLTGMLAGTTPAAAWASVPGGEVFADLSDHVGKAAYFAGDLDRKVTWICSKIVRPGDTVLDIGANIGIVSLWLSDLVGENGHVHSFEPNPDIATILIAGLEKSWAHNISVHQYALGAEEGQLQLLVPHHNRGSASLVRHRGRGSCDAYTVAVRRLTDVMSERSIGPVRFVKMDVEGFEENVFHGAEEVLRSSPPEAILFESAEEGSGDGVIDLLRSHGYEIYMIPRCLTSMHVRRLDPAMQQEGGHSDLLAVHKGPSHAEIRAAVQAVD